MTSRTRKSYGDPEFIGYVQRSVDWGIRRESIIYFIKDESKKIIKELDYGSWTTNI